MRTIKLIISYDGTNYVGWQRQPNGVSIQGRIEDAIATMTGRRSAVTAAGRTDGGVHALAQVAHFTTPSKILCEGFVAGLNSMLPDDISILAAEEMKTGFNSRRDAKGKVYRYRILVSKTRSPLLLNRCWQVRGPLDAGAMKKAAAVLVGEHDFASFRASGCGSRHARRRVGRIEIIAADWVRNYFLNFPLLCKPARRPAGGEGQGEVDRDLPPPTPPYKGGGCEGKIIEIEFEGNGFVRHMIRNIVGTLVDVGKGRLSSADLSKILLARKREQAGRCAPACGLYLVEVLY
ncbi:MAG: tRNA pseudouridine synthase A [bacterium]